MFVWMFDGRGHRYERGVELRSAGGADDSLVEIIMRQLHSSAAAGAVDPVVFVHRVSPLKVSNAPTVYALRIEPCAPKNVTLRSSC
jgi:hypothetical protein